METKNAKPIFSIRIGNIEVAAWEHTNAAGNKYHSISYEKNYLDETEEWQKTKSLLANDIFNLQLGLQKTYEFIKIKN